MSFFRRRRPDPLDPGAYASLESFAYGLMLQGVETGHARDLIRAAVRRYRAQTAVSDLEWRRERAEDARERQELAASIAAERLLREVGWRDEEDPWS